MKWGPDGLIFHDSEEISNDAAAAVRGVKFKRTTRYTDDGDPIVTEQMDLDHHSKNEPLRLLAIHTGLMEKALESNARHFDRFLKALTGEYVPDEAGGTGRSSGDSIRRSRRSFRMKNAVAFGKKQKSVILHSDARINSYDGPVRSGKTVGQRYAFIKWLPTCPHQSILISGKTKDTIRRNILDDLLEAFDLFSIPFQWNRADGVITCRHLGERYDLHVIGANDEASESRVRGLTIGGWLGDELTLHPESFVKMALSRMSMAGAQGFWTTNPDSPYHYLYTEYLTNQILKGRDTKAVLFSAQR